MVLGTAHAIFASFMHTHGLSYFLACAQQGSMLTLASLSRVPISTSTTGTVKCWFFFSEALILFRATLGGVPTDRLQKEHTVLTLKASGVDFFPLGLRDSKIKIPGITRFLIREICRLQNYFDRLIVFVIF